MPLACCGKTARRRCRRKSEFTSLSARRGRRSRMKSASNAPRSRITPKSSIRLSMFIVPPSWPRKSGLAKGKTRRAKDCGAPDAFLPRRPRERDSVETSRPIALMLSPASARMNKRRRRWNAAARRRRLRSAQWQWRGLTWRAAESFVRLQIEQEFLSAAKSSRNRKRESRTADETRCVPLKPGAFLGPR